MRKQIIAGLTGIALCVSLAACSGGGNTVTPPAEKPAPAEPAEQAAPDVASFGSSVEFPNGVAVTVTQPAVVALSQTAAGGVEGQAVTFDVALTNNGSEPYDAFAESAPSVTYGESGQKAELAIDPESGLNGDMFSTILPGETQTVKVGYGIPAAEFGNIRVEVSPSTLTDDPAIFKGAVQ